MNIQNKKEKLAKVVCVEEMIADKPYFAAGEEGVECVRFFVRVVSSEGIWYLLEFNADHDLPDVQTLDNLVDRRFIPMELGAVARIELDW